MRVLVVEDQPKMRLLLCRGLQEGGFAVDAVPDGLSAVHQATEAAYDAMVLDIALPGIDGFEVLRRMKNDERTADTPVIMLTAKTDFPSVAQGWNMDVDNYVTKPFDVNELAKAVTDVLTYRGKMTA